LASHSSVHKTSYITESKGRSKLNSAIKFYLGELASKKNNDSAEEKNPGKASDVANGGWLQDVRTRKIFGIFVVLLSVYLFLASLSYTFTSHSDLRLIQGSELQSEPNETYRNWMGSLGAHTGWLMMDKFFGLGALFFPFILFVWGCKIWLRREILPIWKTVRIVAFGMIAVPMLFAFISYENVPGSRSIELGFPTLVGGIAHMLAESCLYSIGWSGTLMLLIFSFGAFLVLNFNHGLERMWARWMEWRANRNTEKPQEPDEADLPEEEPSPKKKVKNEFRQQEDEEKKNELLTSLPSEPVQEVVSDFTENVDSDNVGIELETEVSPPQEDLPLIIDSPVDEVSLEIEIPQPLDEALDVPVAKVTEDMGPYDPKLDLSRFEFPPVDILKAHGTGNLQIDKDELEANKNKIVETLNHYKIEIAKIKATIGPTVTLYEIVPAPGVRISKIKNLEDDIALSLAALGIRIIAPIPGKGTIGIEVPNSKADVVSMRSLIQSDKFQHSDMELPVALGKTISNELFIADLTKMPHLLMAGATGQGKSVGLNAILVSLLYKKHPAEIKFVLVDPKKVELTLFNKIERHYLAKLPDASEAIITDVQKVVRTLSSLCVEMDMRYELLKIAACRTIKEYNKKFTSRQLNPENGHRYLPYIVLVVDEFADLIMTAGREVETPIARLAQLARAVGIHLIIATQRPSVNIITGTIKANFPARIAFRVTSKIDSRTILDSGGAEQLIGRGDMLYSTGNDLIRLQCGFVDTPEVEEITDYIGSQQAYPSAFILPEVVDENGGDGANFAEQDRDELFDEAARTVVMTQQGSASMLQRKLKLGYNRAGRLIDQLEAAGVIGPFEGSKARKVMFSDIESLEQFLRNLKG
jgi:S-DNA-T family DNA segregation ATPase FtsK/SpoIIIE